jgi:short-subunit dehydrogenase
MPTIVITGCTRGIGYAIARRFAEKYQIIGCGKDPERTAALKAKHPTWDVQTYDLSFAEQAKAFGHYVLSRYEQIDILINNAGAFEQGSLLTESDETFTRMMRTNLESAYYLTKVIAPRMVAQRSGWIVQMASVASIRPYPQGGSYAVAKAALLAYSRNLREELKAHQVAVTAILLGPTLTDSWKGRALPARALHTGRSGG